MGTEDKEGARRFNVLVVDDEQGMRDLFAFTLHSEGYNVTTVANGYEALNSVREGPFDLAFIDVKMPQMDGLETYRALKEIVPDLGVFMMTAYSVEDLVRQALREGALGCLYKPFEPEEILTAVERIKNNRQKNRR
jgi:CheY-like chemotaxis protein